MSKAFGVGIVPTGLPTIRIGSAGHHVVPALKPGKTRKLVASLRVVSGVYALYVLEHPSDVLDHQTVIAPRFFRLVRLDFIKVLAPLFQVFKLLLAKRVRTCRRRTEIGVNRLPAPSGLDEENRFLESLLHVDSEGELRPDLVPCFGRVSPGTVSGGQLAVAFPHVVPSAREIGNPHLIANDGVALPIDHFLQDWLGQGIRLHRLESADLGMTLHIGLAAKNEDFERLGVNGR